MPTIGVVVICLQGMKHVAECLQSVRWADRVLLLHTDGGEPDTGGGEFPSLQIRRVGSPAAAGAHLSEIGTDWVLQLWGEERAEGGLGEELRALCRDRSGEAPSSYRIPVRSYLLGRWASGSVSGPSPAVRFARNVEEIPPGWWAAGKSTAALPRGWIGDYGCSELSDAADYVQGLSDFWAGRLRGAVFSPSSARTVLCSLRVFVKMILLNRLFSRGLAGVALSALASYAVLLSGAKLWEAKHVGVKRRA